MKRLSDINLYSLGSCSSYSSLSSLLSVQGTVQEEVVS